MISRANMMKQMAGAQKAKKARPANGYKCGGKVKKGYAKGGPVCRGMGAAQRGGKYKK